MKKFAEEFKKFITKGNILDLAVAVVIGTAFSKIVNSLVKDVLMPVISLITGEEGFTNYKYIIVEANEAEGIAENAIYYGQFIQNIVDFFIIALVVFLMIKFINRTRVLVDKAQEEFKEAITEQKVKTDAVLTDIKELLKENLK